MMEAAAPAPALDARVVESVLVKGDLAQLTTEQRVSFYNHVCESLGLNPLTQPFAYITLNGKLTLYAKKDCAEQLRFIHNISINPDKFTREVIEGVYIVTAPASMPSGRTDVSTGAVPIAGIQGEARANAMMKAETKAKRRVTLSICGLGMLDETEAEPLATREPQYAVEAEKKSEPLPEGTVQIIKVQPKRKGPVEWADVTYVDAKGEEHTHPIPGDPRGGAAALCEQLAQEGAPVELVVAENSRGKVVIEEVTRWQAPEPDTQQGTLLPPEEQAF